MSPVHRSWEDYFIPGTDVLRNKFSSPDAPYGVDRQAKLEELEAFSTGMRMRQLKMDPLEGSFDYDHFKAIHQYLFQDVYDWAGEERTAPPILMTKDGHAYFAAGPQLTEYAETQFELIKKTNFLQGMSRQDFVTELGERWGELNVAHSFREGNTRTQSVFFDQLAQHAGWSLDMSRFAEGADLREEFIAARYECQDTGSSARLAAVLDQAIEPLQRDDAAQVGVENALSVEAKRAQESALFPLQGAGQRRGAWQASPDLEKFEGASYVADRSFDYSYGAGADRGYEL